MLAVVELAAMELPIPEAQAVVLAALVAAQTIPAAVLGCPAPSLPHSRQARMGRSRAIRHQAQLMPRAVAVATVAAMAAVAAVAAAAIGVVRYHIGPSPVMAAMALPASWCCAPIVPRRQKAGW